MPFLAFTLGPLEIALIFVVVLVFFGVGKLPQVGGAVGRAIREFRSNVREESSEETVPSRQLPKASSATEAERTPTSATAEGQESPRS